MEVEVLTIKAQAEYLVVLVEVVVNHNLELLVHLIKVLLVVMVILELVVEAEEHLKLVQTE